MWFYYRNKTMRYCRNMPLFSYRVSMEEFLLHKKRQIKWHSSVPPVNFIVLSYSLLANWYFGNEIKKGGCHIDIFGFQIYIHSVRCQLWFSYWFQWFYRLTNWLNQPFQEAELTSLSIWTYAYHCEIISLSCFLS